MPKAVWEDCKALLRAERERNYEPEGWDWIKDYSPKPRKPDFGTPEFWAYHRAKKAAENKRREAEGLPPLPTKKELEAEKAKKKAEREAAKATKEAAKAAKKSKA